MLNATSPEDLHETPNDEFLFSYFIHEIYIALQIKHCKDFTD